MLLNHRGRVHSRDYVFLNPVDTWDVLNWDLTKCKRLKIGKIHNTYAQHGVCTYLLHGATEDLYLRAMQSAGAYLHYLRHQDENQKVTSEARPLYDAIGARHWPAAIYIAQASRLTRNPSYEYEEDFLFVLFLLEHFFLGADDTECRQIIAAHERAAKGADVAHRQVCQALLDGDSALFDDALKDLLVARQERVENLVAREMMPPEVWSWLRYFSREGWALLKYH